jgi:hypothetical protein
MPIFKGDGFVEDEWTVAADETPLPAGGAVVSKARFVAEREALTARKATSSVSL